MALGRRQPAKTVLITSPKPHALLLKKLLRPGEIRAVLCPLIRILPPPDWKRFDRLARVLDRYDWLVFTSAFGVENFFGRLRTLGLKNSLLRPVRIAVVGSSTANTLKRAGCRPDLVALRTGAKALFADLKKRAEIRGKRFLLARTDIAGPFLRQALRRANARVTEVCVYRTRPAVLSAPDFRSRLRGLQPDFISFTSGSSVRVFFRLLGKQKGLLRGVRFVTLGPETSACLREFGFRPYRQACNPSLKSLAEVLSKP